MGQVLFIGVWALLAVNICCGSLVEVASPARARSPRGPGRASGLITSGRAGPRA